MITYRALEWDVAQIENLVKESWITSYQKRLPVPIWDRNHFQWSKDAMPAWEQELSIGMYDEEETLIGCALSFPSTYRIGGEKYKGSLFSWVTIHPGYQTSPGLGIQLCAEFLDKHKKAGFDFLVGGIHKDITRKFWQKASSSLNHELTFMSEFGVYMNVLDSRKYMEWLEMDEADEDIFSSVASLLPFPRNNKYKVSMEATESGLQRFTSEVFNSALNPVDFYVEYPPDRLLNEFKHKLLKTLYLVSDKICGLISYYPVNIVGGDRIIKAAYISNILFSDKIENEPTIDFIHEALKMMKDEECVIAIASSLTAFKAELCTSTGFLFMGESHYLGISRFNKELDLSKIHTLYLNLR